MSVAGQKGSRSFYNKSSRFMALGKQTTCRDGEVSVLPPGSAGPRAHGMRLALHPPSPGIQDRFWAVPLILSFKSWPEAVAFLTAASFSSAMAVGEGDGEQEHPRQCREEKWTSCWQRNGEDSGSHMLLVPSLFSAKKTHLVSLYLWLSLNVEKGRKPFKLLRTVWAKE